MYENPRQCNKKLQYLYAQESDSERKCNGVGDLFISESAEMDKKRFCIFMSFIWTNQNISFNWMTMVLCLPVCELMIICQCWFIQLTAFSEAWENSVLPTQCILMEWMMLKKTIVILTVNWLRVGAWVQVTSMSVFCQFMIESEMGVHPVTLSLLLA